MKQCIYEHVVVRLHVCGESSCENFNSLYLFLMCWHYEAH
jgi:hypothetical protein